jgi:hypothetical protein
MILAVSANGIQRRFSCTVWGAMDKTGWTEIENTCGGRAQNLGRPFAHGEDRSGGGGDKHYHFVQNTPSDTWSVTHNLNKYPSVLVRDSAGSIIEGECNYDTLNTMTLTFSAPFSGFAELN